MSSPSTTRPRRIEDGSSAPPAGASRRPQGTSEGSALAAVVKLVLGFVLAVAAIVWALLLLAAFPDPVGTAALVGPPVLVAALVLDTKRRRLAAQRRRTRRAAARAPRS